MAALISPVPSSQRMHVMDSLNEHQHDEKEERGSREKDWKPSLKGWKCWIPQECGRLHS